MPKIFVDTWAWYALADRKDTDHRIAEAANIQLLVDGYTFVTTNFVFSESVTLIRYKMYKVSSWINLERAELLTSDMFGSKYRFFTLTRVEPYFLSELQFAKF